MGLAGGRRDWRLTVGTISGGHFLSHFYVLSFPPLFPAWQAEFGLSNVQLGLLMSAPLVASLFQLPVGMLVDRIGAKSVFVAGVGLTAGGIALVGTAGSFPMMLAFAALSGIGQSAFHPAGYAMIESAASAANKGKSFSVHMFSGYAGFSTAPVVVGGLSLLASWRLALVIVGAAGLAYAALASVTLAPRYRARTSGAAAGGRSVLASLRGVTSPSILTVFLFFIASTAGVKGIQTFTTVLLVESYGYVEAVGNTALTTYFVASSAGILAGGVLADRIDPRTLIVGSLVLAGAVVGSGVAGLFETGAWPAVAVFLVAGLVVGTVYPARDRLVSRYSTAGTAGRSFGFVYTGTTVGGLLTPPVLGYVIDLTAPSAAFGLVAASFLVAAGIVALLALGAVPAGQPTTSRSD